MKLSESQDRNQLEGLGSLLNYSDKLFENEVLYGLLDLMNRLHHHNLVCLEVLIDLLLLDQQEKQ